MLGSVGMKLFYFFFLEGHKNCRVGTKKKKNKKKTGSVGEVETQVGLFYFLGLSTIFTRTGSFVLVLNQNYEKQVRASKLDVSPDNYRNLLALNLYMLVLY